MDDLERLQFPLWFDTPPRADDKKNCRAYFGNTPDDECVGKPELQGGEKNSSVEKGKGKPDQAHRSAWRAAAKAWNDPKGDAHRQLDEPAR